MQRMSISPPGPLKQFVDDQIFTGRYSSSSEYVRELIRADERRKAEELFEAKVLEGLSSAESGLDSRPQGSHAGGQSANLCAEARRAARWNRPALRRQWRKSSAPEHS